MKPRTTTVGAKEQNGDVEAANGTLKRALEQSLLMRGSRDFESVGIWQAFVDDVMRKANRARGRRLTEEMEAMRALDVAKLPEFVEEPFCVSEWSTRVPVRESFDLGSEAELAALRIAREREVEGGSGAEEGADRGGLGAGGGGRRELGGDGRGADAHAAG